MKFHELLQVCLAPDAPVLRVLTTPEDEVCRMNVRQLTDGLMRVIVRDFERGAYNGIKPSDLMHRVDHLLLSTERILKYLKSFKDGEYIEGLRREYRLNIRKAFGSVEERRDAYAPGDPDAVPDIKPFQKILNDLRDDIILLFLTRNVFPDYAMALERLKNTDRQLDIASSRPAWLHCFYLGDRQYVNYHEPIGYLTDAQVKASLVPKDPAPWDLHIVLDQRGICTIPKSVRHLEGVANFVRTIFSRQDYIPQGLQPKPLFVGSRSASLTSINVEDEKARRAMAERMLYQVAQNIGDRLFKEGWMPETGFTIALHSLLTLTASWPLGIIQYGERLFGRDPETTQILDIWEAVKAWGRRKQSIKIGEEVVPVTFRLITYGCNTGRNAVVGEEEAKINKEGYRLFINSVRDYVRYHTQREGADGLDEVDAEIPDEAISELRKEGDPELISIFSSLSGDQSLENWFQQKQRLGKYIIQLAAERLAQDSLSKRKLFNILSLFVQIQELFIEEGKKYKEDRYIFELHARMILLENLIGESPHIFCKSGCDRTGILEELLQTYLASEDQHGRYPTLDEVDFDVAEVKPVSRKHELLRWGFDIKQYACGKQTADANKIGARALKLDVEHRDKHGRMLRKSEKPISKLVDKGWEVSVMDYRAKIKSAEQRHMTRSRQMEERSAAIPADVKLLQQHISNPEFLPALLNLLVAKRKKESFPESRAFELLCVQGLAGDIPQSLPEWDDKLSLLELACLNPRHYAVFKFMKDCIALYWNRNIDIDAPSDVFVELRKSQFNIPKASEIYLFATVLWEKFIFPPSVQTNDAICFVHREPAIKDMLLLYYARLSDVVGGKYDQEIERLMDAFEEDRVPDIFRCRAALDRLPADVSMAVNAPWRVRSENCLRKVCSKFEVDPEQILELAAEPVGVTLLTM